jgi:hypothetical protein
VVGPEGVGNALLSSDHMSHPQTLRLTTSERASTPPFSLFGDRVAFNATYRAALDGDFGVKKDPVLVTYASHFHNLPPGSYVTQSLE